MFLSLQQRPSWLSSFLGATQTARDRQNMCSRSRERKTKRRTPGLHMSSLGRLYVVPESTFIITIIEI